MIQEKGSNIKTISIPILIVHWTNCRRNFWMTKLAKLMPGFLQFDDEDFTALVFFKCNELVAVADIYRENYGGAYKK